MLQCHFPPASEQFERLSPSTEVLSSQLSCENVLIEEPAGFTGMGVDGLSSLFCSKFMESVASFFKMYMQEAYSGEYSSTGNVAIDNKIEQAMDLVKSHLMFAVREEVEILKEQIKELLAKNNQLEYENRVLREDATPETLAKLSSNQAL